MVYIILTKDHMEEVVGPGKTAWLFNSNLHFYRCWGMQRPCCWRSQDGDQCFSKSSNAVTGSESPHHHF